MITRLSMSTRIQTFSERLKLFHFIKSLNKVKPIKKILFGSGFNINKTFTNHDIIIAGLLREKGAEIHYPYGRKGLRTHYPFWGGVWGNSDCTNNSKTLMTGENRAFNHFNKIGYTHNMADFINETDLKTINNIVSGLTETEILSFQYLDIYIGHDAMNTVRNLFMVDQISLVNNYLEEWNASLHDCMVITLFFERIINKIQPEIIFTHDCFYMPWSLISKLADKHGIKFYNYYMGLYPDTWIYANRKPAMEFELMDNIWLENKNHTLNEKQNNRLESLLSDRKKGKTGNFTLDTSEDQTELEHLLARICDAPFAVYYLNVFWDLAALDKELIFHSIKESLIYLIEWFTVRPHFNFVLKPHPAEKHKLIPETMYNVEKILSDHFNDNLPSNIFYLDAKTTVSAYDLFSHSNLSITWTGTIGIESTLYDTHTIVLAKAHYRGKGFTIDPISIDELDTALEKYLASKQKLKDTNIALARKYFYLFQYQLSKDVGIPTMRYVGKVPDLKWKTAEEYLENKNLEKVINEISFKQEISA